MFVLHRKHRPPLPITGIALHFLYFNYVLTSQGTNLWSTRAIYGIASLHSIVKYFKVKFVENTKK
jgi:hypothetical protein